MVTRVRFNDWLVTTLFLVIKNQTGALFSAIRYYFWLFNLVVLFLTLWILLGSKFCKLYCILKKFRSQNLLFQLPLTAYLASYLGQKKSASISFSNGASKSHISVKDEHKWGNLWRIYMTFVLFITFVLQLYGSLSFWQAYGLMAFVFSPVKTWSLFLLVFLVRKVRNIVNCSATQRWVIWSHWGRCWLILGIK